jgi:hypothetical protein
MARIARVTASLFGVNAPSETSEQYGSQTQLGSAQYLNSPIMASDIAEAQGLSAWTTGWSAAINAGNKAPYLQDMNSVHQVLSWMICEILQDGLPPWDSNTTYYTGSAVQDPNFSGYWYVSLQDNNQGNTPPPSASNAWWQWVNAVALAGNGETGQILQSNGPGAVPSWVPRPVNSTRQVLTVGSGATYTTPANVQQLRIRMVGGGGGGGGHDGAGGNGSDSIFNSIHAGGGAGGSFGGYATPGGIGGSNPTGTASFRVRGNGGGPSSLEGATSQGGAGGGSALGGGSPGSGDAGSTSQPGTSADNNTGGGGSGCATYNSNSGAGGGGGEYVEIIINNPSASYLFTIGAGGTAGTGSSGPAGGSGGSGLIIVDEYY